MASAKEFALVNPPSDGISTLRFSPSDNSALLASSWDGHLRLYDTSANALTADVALSAGPLFDACFSGDGQTVYASGLDRTVRSYSLGAGSENGVAELGGHGDAVRCVEFSAAHGLLLTGSWDRTVKAWDPRTAGSDGRPSHTFSVPDRVYSMALCGQDTLAVATAGRHVLLFDLRKRALSAARESSLKHQTRIIRPFIDGAGFASGSIEGRVAIDFLDPSPSVQAAKYAFKCHRAKGPAPAVPGAPQEEAVFPVHALAFHPVHGTFATGGGDGHVSVWDWRGRKRLHQSHNYGTSISALAFNRDGTQLAVAASYAFEQGDRPHPADAILVRAVADSDVRPKAAGAGGAVPK